ncbi:MAG: hypothetical protein H0T41_05190, partial [Rhodobacteraceae bacterium]|nr:hypothetical protein [Paracoccaceae bacterium]
MSDASFLERIGQNGFFPRRPASGRRKMPTRAASTIDRRQQFARRDATTANFDQRANEPYDAHYYNRNSWYLAIKSRALPHVIRGEELIADEDLARSEFGGDWCRRVGVFYLGGMHPVTDGLALATAAYRDRTEGGFLEVEKRRFSIVVQHLARAFQIAARLGMLAERQGFCLELLDDLDLGVVLLDEIGRVEFLNGVAERVARLGRRPFYRRCLAAERPAGRD